MALKKGNNQISFQFLEGKRFVKAIELVESHLFSYTYGDLMGQMNHQIFQIKEEHNLIYSIRMCCP